MQHSEGAGNRQTDSKQKEKRRKSWEKAVVTMWGIRNCSAQVTPVEMMEKNCLFWRGLNDAATFLSSAFQLFSDRGLKVSFGVWCGCLCATNGKSQVERCYRWPI